MSNREAQELERAERLAKARHLAKAWAYWCLRTHFGDIGGKPPRAKLGGMDRRYRSPPQWHPPEPRLPEPDENVGMAVQRAFIQLPAVYRKALRSEFCLKPWIIPTADTDVDVWLARKARVSIGAYQATVSRSLLALSNQMARQGTWA